MNNKDLSFLQSENHNKACDDMTEYYIEMHKIEAKAEKKRMEALDFVKSNVSTEMFEDIEFYIQECEKTSLFEITEIDPDPEWKQSEEGNYDHLKEVYVFQYCNGGYVGDDFAGWVHIKVTDKAYLKFHYSM